MTRHATALIFCCGLAMPSLALAQSAMLTPPDNHYFVSEGSWGQKYADQWPLHRIGFDCSAKFGLAARQARCPAGRCRRHRHRARLEPPEHRLGEYLAQPEETTADTQEGRRRHHRLGLHRSDTTDPGTIDGHGTFIAGIIAGSWKDKDGIAGINPFARLMILKALNNFGHTRAVLHRPGDRLRRRQRRARH